MHVAGGFDAWCEDIDFTGPVFNQPMLAAREAFMAGYAVAMEVVIRTTVAEVRAEEGKE